MKPVISIRPLERDDYDACAQIYREGLATGIASFETEVPNWETWNKKYLKQCRFVAESDETTLGWIALTPFSLREVYSGVAEVSLYVAHKAQGKVIGKELLQYLINSSEKKGFWTLQAKIFPQNEKSIQLFMSCDFKLVGRRKKIAMRDDVWHDNLLFERRREQ